MSSPLWNVLLFVQKCYEIAEDFSWNGFIFVHLAKHSVSSFQSDTHPSDLEIFLILFHNDLSSFHFHCSFILKLLLFDIGIL